MIIVYEQARFHLPPNYHTDRYLGDVIKRQPIRRYAYPAIIGVTGILLTWEGGWNWVDWALILKIVASISIGLLLGYVPFAIQPRIEHILENYQPGEEVSAGGKPALIAFRSRTRQWRVDSVLVDD